MSSPMLFVSFFRWFDEISVVFEAEKKSHRKGVTSKRMVAWDIHFGGGIRLLVETRVIVFSLEVTLERVCWPYKWKCEKERESEDERIYRKFLSWNRLQKRRTKLQRRT